MRFAVFGAGGVGGYLGARLAEAGEDVAFIARGEHLRAIRERGLRLESIAGDAVIDLADAIGPQHVLGGLCGMVSFIAGPGHIRHAGAQPWIAFGELDGRVTDRVRRLKEAFRRCRGLKVDVPADITVALWEKFLFITATGGVGAVTRAPFGAFRALPETRRMLEGAMREVVAVARARGIEVSDDAVTRALSLMDGLEPHGTSSMQRDIMAGRRSELDAWNGAVARLGREAGVETPVHDFIYATLLPQELRARGELEFPEA